MKNSFKTFCCLAIAILPTIKEINAQNPIIQTYFTADPAPMVHNETVYLYTSHDEDSTIDNFFTMYNWRCYSSTDMVNWTDHGAIATLKNLPWINKTNGAWAPQCIERNGKFYLYVPIHGEGISVLVSDTPTGPFSDPLGKRLITDSENIWHDIDPTVFVDDNGQAYLFWGNPYLYYVKLNNDMISYDQSIGKNGIVAVEMTADAFGTIEKHDEKKQTAYTEGPWFYKRNNLYYMIYAAAGIPEYIAYSTAPKPEGPWTYKGFIMERAPHLAFTNHAGIIDFKGNSYFFYHSHELSGGEGFKRSICVEPFTYNANGTIPLITPTKQGIQESVSTINPYKRVQAETIAWSHGLKTATDSTTGVYVTKIENGSLLKVRSVDLGKGAKIFEAAIASEAKGGKIEIRLNNQEGELIGTLEVASTGGLKNWTVQPCTIKKTQGIHDLYFIFKVDTDQSFNFDWWILKQ